MQTALPDVDNTLKFLLVQADGTVLTTGTVNVHLQIKTGTNAGKWWTGTAWDDDDSVAGVAAYDSDSGFWTITITELAWTTGNYHAYAKHAVSSHLPSGDEVVCRELDAEEIGSW